MKLSSLVLGPLAILLSVAPAFSQTPAFTEPESGYVSVAVGAIATSPVNPVFFGEYAENMGQHAQAYVNLSYMNNMMRANTRDALTAAFASGTDRGVSVTGGGKLIVKTTGLVRPYIGGGAGIVYITRSITDTRVVFANQAVFNDFGSSNSSLLSASSVTKPLGEIIGGIGFNAGHTFVDAGYRYRRVFGLNQLDTYDFSQLTAGVGYRW